MFCYFLAKPFLAKLEHKSTTKKSNAQALLCNNNKKQSQKLLFKEKHLFICINKKKVVPLWA